MRRPLTQVSSDCQLLLKGIQYGILGGLAANPVSIAFRDFPPDLLSYLWRRALRDLPRKQMVEIWSHADIQRLKNRIHNTRVILTYSGQERTISSNVLDWLVELRRTGSQPLPAILSVYHQSSADTPGATLVAQGDDDFSDRLGLWLQQHSEFLKLPEVDPDNGLSVDTSRLRAAIRHAAVGRSISVRDIHIVTGLVAGAAINEAMQDGALIKNIQVPGPQHYAEVYGLLNARPFHTIEHPHDDITLFMVARANAYLQTKADNSAVKPTRLGGRVGSASTLQEAKPAATDRPRHITRRELVDLGNPKSSLVKKLLENIAQSNDVEVLKRIGFTATVRSRESQCTRKPDASELIKSMTTWTYKMVRTRFDRLQSEGLIEARKTANNAALEYMVPEEFINGRSRFAQLPAPEEVKTNYEST